MCISISGMRTARERIVGWRMRRCPAISMRHLRGVFRPRGRRARLSLRRFIQAIIREELSIFMLLPMLVERRFSLSPFPLLLNSNNIVLIREDIEWHWYHTYRAFPNGTYQGSTVSHIGQLFFDTSLSNQIEALTPYSTNLNPGSTTNANDGIFRE